MDIILTRILECMGNKYGAGKELANYLGLSGNVITNWKNGSNHSYMKYLPQIAEFYDVSESYLLGKSDSKLRPAVLEEVQDILSDPDIVMFARHTKKIPRPTASGFWTISAAPSTSIWRRWASIRMTISPKNNGIATGERRAIFCALR